MNICVISPSYPTQGKQFYPFVENLCNKWADMGNNVFVITPVSKTKRLLRKKKKYPYSQISYKSDNGTVTVYTPEYITIGNMPVVGGAFNFRSIERCIEKTIKRNQLNIDIVYAHFWRSGLNVYKAAKKRNLPLFIATGESQIFIPSISSKVKDDFSKYVSGVVCVSTKNKEESIAMGLTNYNKCIVIPNAINPNTFYKKEKNALRKSLGYNVNDFIVAFVGFFIKRKGPKRVTDAIELLNDDGIKSIFVGSSSNQAPEEPAGKSILFKGVLSNNQIVDYLNCSDVFVLPTLQEGCCNAIIEAMACGLPIISSNLPFNWDVLNESNSIMIDPENVENIAEAIKKLKEDIQLRNTLSDGSLNTARELTIEKRAANILNFMNKSRI